MKAPVSRGTPRGSLDGLRNDHDHGFVFVAGQEWTGISRWTFC